MSPPSLRPSPAARLGQGSLSSHTPTSTPGRLGPEMPLLRVVLRLMPGAPGGLPGAPEHSSRGVCSFDPCLLSSITKRASTE